MGRGEGGPCSETLRSGRTRGGSPPQPRKPVTEQFRGLDTQLPDEPSASHLSAARRTAAHHSTSPASNGTSTFPESRVGRSRRGGLGAAWPTAGWWKSAGEAEHPALPRRRLLHKASCHPVQCGVSGMTQPFQTFAASSGDGGSLRESSCSFVAVWRESEPRYIHPPCCAPACLLPPPPSHD